MNQKLFKRFYKYSLLQLRNKENQDWMCCIVEQNSQPSSKMLRNIHVSSKYQMCLVAQMAKDKYNMNISESWKVDIDKLTYSTIIDNVISSAMTILVGVTILPNLRRSDVLQLRQLVYAAVHMKDKNLIAYLMYKYQSVKEDKHICAFAALLGDLEMLTYLYSNGFKWCSYTCSCAVKSGSLDCLQYAYTHGCDCDNDAYQVAIRFERLNCLQYLQENTLPYVQEDDAELLSTYAAQRGNLQCLTYLHKCGYIWNENTCKVAARNGHLQCLRYLHENGCPWNEETCAYAAEGGHLECLKYVVKNHCPFTYLAYILAKINLQEACLAYIKDHFHISLNWKELEVERLVQPLNLDYHDNED